MKIYLLGDEKEYSYSINDFKKAGDVLFVDNFSEIFSDPDEKILGIAPGVVKWTFELDDLKKIQNLKGICTKSSWGYYIDIEYCRQHHIPVCHLPGTNSRSVAEYAFWQMLSLAKHLPRQIEEKFVTQHDESHYQTEISYKKIGIVGLGKVGGHLADMASGFGMDVWYAGRSKKENKYTFAPIEELLKNCDFVFNCLEICPDTQNYFDKEKLSLMKPTAFFISVMGGAGWGIEDNELLVNMVADARLAGYSVENEHKGEFNIKISNNVFIPSAYAWYTDEAHKRSEKMFTETMLGLVSGKVINEIK
jgi:phosphoglycerate dehydrogenase-like enzyme